MSINYIFCIDEFETELKQHINLSESAWLTIDEDIKNFYEPKEKKSFSGFLNRVFKNFYQKADATISLRFIEKEEELEKLYSSKEFSSFDKKTISLFIGKYINVYEQELKEKALSYPSGHGEKFRINKENLDILRESSEANYYEGIIGKYLKAIFEEYALKPLYIREQIFFNDVILTIQNAIYRKKKLKISLLEKTTVQGDSRYIKKYLVSPYYIVQDKTNSFNYLIGYSEEIKDTVVEENGFKRKTIEYGEKTPACFRISRIGKIDMQISMGMCYSQDKANILNEMLIKRTPMYMSGEPITIKIQFSDKGLESFKRQLYMRPQFYTVDKTDKHIYYFECTEIQAINYFFKFGWDALVLEPTDLAEKFKKRYERALKTYNGISRIDITKSEKK